MILVDALKRVKGNRGVQGGTEGYGGVGGEQGGTGGIGGAEHRDITLRQGVMARAGERTDTERMNECYSANIYSSPYTDKKIIFYYVTCKCLLLLHSVNCLIYLMLAFILFLLYFV